jgi:Domain of unknown function (DUF1840)
MAVTFKTRACGEVTMLDANAKQVLALIGKEFGVRGVITAAEAPAALAKLAAAVAAQGGGRGPDEASDPDAARAYVPLKTRLAPFVEMLERAHAGSRDILWGV